MIDDPVALLRIESLRKRSPDAVELATYASIAINIEPELLRALRLSLAPHFDVSAEADFWLSRLVEARSYSSVTLQPSVAHALRNRLQKKVARKTAHRAWQIVRELHTKESPAIAHEEALAWAAISGNVKDVEDGLKSVLKTMTKEPERGLVAWWLRARERLPEAVRQSAIAASIDRRAIDRKSTTPGFGMDIHAAGTRKIFARAGAAALEVGDFDVDKATVALSVPDVDPVRLEIRSLSDSATTHVALRPGEARVVPVTGGAAAIKTESGAVFETRYEATPPSGSEMLLLANVLQATLKGFLTAAKPKTDEYLEHATPLIERIVGEFIDPPWQRARRLLTELSELGEDTSFAEVCEACFARIEDPLWQANPSQAAKKQPRTI